MIDAEQFAEWKEHPVTKEVYAGLIEVRDSILAQLANGNTVGATADDTHGFTNRAIGQLDGLSQMLEISYEGPSADELDTKNKSRY